MNCNQLKVIIETIPESLKNTFVLYNWHDWNDLHDWNVGVYQKRLDGLCRLLQNKYKNE